MLVASVSLSMNMAPSPANIRSVRKFFTFFETSLLKRKWLSGLELRKPCCIIFYCSTDLVQEVVTYLQTLGYNPNQTLGWGKSLVPAQYCPPFFQLGNQEDWQGVVLASLHQVQSWWKLSQRREAGDVGGEHSDREQEVGPDPGPSSYAGS